MLEGLKDPEKICVIMGVVEPQVDRLAQLEERTGAYSDENAENVRHFCL